MSAYFSIYMIIDYVTNNCYIGSTTSDIEFRLLQHETTYETSSRTIIDNKNYSIEHVATYPLKTAYDRFRKEAIFMLSANQDVLVNECLPVNYPYLTASKEDLEHEDEQTFKDLFTNSMTTCVCGQKYLNFGKKKRMHWRSLKHVQCLANKIIKHDQDTLSNIEMLEKPYNKCSAYDHVYYYGILIKECFNNAVPAIDDKNVNIKILNFFYKDSSTVKQYYLSSWLKLNTLNNENRDVEILEKTLKTLNDTSLQ